ncbi:MAG: hypothetical protein ACRDNF_19490, partial [Streptosporangiaceae bacterium]
MNAGSRTDGELSSRRSGSKRRLVPPADTTARTGATIAPPPGPAGEDTRPAQTGATDAPASRAVTAAPRVATARPAGSLEESH